MATGAGKTLLAAKIVEGALSKGNRVTFCVPALSLIDQTVDAFWREGIRDVGVIQGDHPMTNPLRPVQIASAQTLSRRSIPSSEVVVIDECHVQFDVYRRWMAQPEWQRVPFIGLSATPWSKGLGLLFDELIVAATVEELIAAGFLSPFHVFGPSHPNLAGVRTVAGDYHEGDLAEAMDKPALVADVVETWRQLGEGRPTLVFAVNRAHAMHLHERFEEAGIGSAYVDAFTSIDEREAIRKRLDAGEIRVVCNIGTLTTGVDWDVRCIVLARPTKSKMLYVQIIGRGLRLAEGKEDLRVIDHSDTTARLGFVTDIRQDALDDGKPKPKSAGGQDKGPALPQECQKCSFLKPAGTHACPHCGFAPQRQSEVETAAGELVEIGRSEKRKAAPAEKREFLAQLLGFNKGSKWAKGMYRSKFGEWPKTMSVPPAPPRKDVIAWVTHRRIAFAKSKRAA